MENSNLQIATMGAGCYWCIEAMYRQLPGIMKIKSGFTASENRAEVVQITYEPSMLSFTRILKCLFRMHDCTDQKFASGLERSIVLYHNEEQQEIINKFIEELNIASDNKVVTEVSAYAGFNAAKESEQDYYTKNITNEHCSGYIKPKIAKFLRSLKDL